MQEEFPDLLTLNGKQVVIKIVHIKSFKSTIQARSATRVNGPICLLGDRLDMPSSMYDAMGEMTGVAVVFFWVTTPSTHYQGAVVLRKWLFIYVCIVKQ